MPDKTEIAEKAAGLAKRYEFDYGCCPQCVLAAVQETVGGVSDETIKASHGLSGGGGLTGVGLCGSLVGGLIALGAKRGRDRNKFDKGKFIGNFRHSEALIEQFREKFGGVTCQELQQQFTGRTYDMWQAKEYQAFSDARGEQCAETAEFVTRQVVEKL
ncbi:MAG: C-GCAxxG-C-C family protein [Pseudomonadota bacterium]|nr:C-GCAxxG-C-C family protein [Pseudomonadota bacterium]